MKYEPSTVDVIPEQLKVLVTALLEGRLKSLAFVADVKCHDGDEIQSNYFLNIDGNQSNIFALIGAIETMKHNFIVAQAPLRDDDE